jgi:hypothetical protein
MIIFNLTNPNNYIKSASINSATGLTGNLLWCCAVKTRYYNGAELFNTLHGAKIYFAKNFMKGAKWEKVEVDNEKI